MNNQNQYAQTKTTTIGKINFRNDNRLFGIYDKDRLNHIYCLGKSGSGKSTLLLNMAISDIERGNGICIIDPHGDVSEEILNYIPQHRIEDVIYFNPADIEYPIAFNPLKGVHPKHQELVASGMVSVFKKIWIDSWGPRLEYILKMSIETLIEARECSLLDIQPLLTDIEFKESILRRITSQHLLAFWYNEYAKFSSSYRAEAISPILNKVGIFASSIPLRNIVGQKTRSFHIGKVMAEGKILICNLSKGKIGEEVSTILGCLLVTSIQLAALHRATQEQHTRRPYYLYVDEAHSFLTLSFANILSESRKYALSLFITHQYIDQLKEEIRTAIFGNVGTIISFRIGANDASVISQEFLPTFNEHDLVNLPRYCMYLKLMIDGATSQPFSAVSIPLKEKTHSFKDEVITRSRKKYGKNLKDVQTKMVIKNIKDENFSKQKGLF